MHLHHLTRIEDYEPYVGKEIIQRIQQKARAIQHLRVVHVNSTFYGGGVAALLDSLTILMNNLGIKTGWRVIQGAPDFFGITKKIHNAMQGDEIHLSEIKKEIYENTIHKNSLRNHLEHDIVVIHDPQPLPLINFYKKSCSWVWHCHLDLSKPNPVIWDYLKSYVEKYDAMIVSAKEYQQKVKIPQHVIMPAIDPFSLTNKDLTNEEVDERLKHYHIPTDLPIISQTSRFDHAKDPIGVIQAFKIAQKKIQATLVLLGNMASDDPEGESIYQNLLSYQNERIHIISGTDSILVNALQKRSAVVVQKSLKEGFGLTVSEAMWKQTPVIGGNVGGIKYQIQNGINGYLVSSIEETADRMVELVQNKQLREEMGTKAQEFVKKHFLLIRMLEQYLDLFHSLPRCK